MQFLIRRYFVGLAKRRRWLALAAVPPLVLLFAMWIRTDRFTVRQDIQISTDAPVAASQSPTDIVIMSEIITQPSLLFQDFFAISELVKHLQTMKPVGSNGRTHAILTYMVQETMSLKAAGDNNVRIEYHGEEPELGDTLVGWFSQRLQKRVQDGWVRTGRTGKPTVQLVGKLQHESHRALWRPDRLAAIVYTTIISVISVLILLGFLEWGDRSFKSERQVARYLDAPVLGSLPNLDKLVGTVAAKDSQ
jgi:capsular polysaccharide biosynthesis protein